MNSIWLIIRKDAQRFWGPLVLWLILITARHVVEWRAVHALNQDAVWIARMRTAGVLFLGLEMMVGYLLAAAIALEDPVTNSTAFWMTRPISGARLLIGKFLTCVALLVVVPLLVSLPWWTATGLSGGEVLKRAEELGRWHALMMGIALVVATFTGHLGRFVAWSLALFFAGVMAETIAGQAGISFPHPTKFLLAVVVVGFAAAVFVRYHSRSRIAAFVLLTTSAVGAVLLRLQGI